MPKDAGQCLAVVHGPLPPTTIEGVNQSNSQFYLQHSPLSFLHEFMRIFCIFYTLLSSNSRSNLNQNFYTTAFLNHRLQDFFSQRAHTSAIYLLWTISNILNIPSLLRGLQFTFNPLLSSVAHPYWGITVFTSFIQDVLSWTLRHAACRPMFADRRSASTVRAHVWEGLPFGLFQLQWRGGTRLVARRAHE